MRTQTLRIDRVDDEGGWTDALVLSHARDRPGDEFDPIKPQTSQRQRDGGGEGSTPFEKST